MVRSARPLAVTYVRDLFPMLAAWRVPWLTELCMGKHEWHDARTLRVVVRAYNRFTTEVPLEASTKLSAFGYVVESQRNSWSG